MAVMKTMGLPHCIFSSIIWLGIQACSPPRSGSDLSRGNVWTIFLWRTDHSYKDVEQLGLNSVAVQSLKRLWGSELLEANAPFISSDEGNFDSWKAHIPYILLILKCYRTQICAFYCSQAKLPSEAIFMEGCQTFSEAGEQSDWLTTGKGCRLLVS